MTKDLWKRGIITSLSWTIGSGILVRIITACATILLARGLGPAAFGELQLAFAVGLVLQIPCFGGMPLTIMHYVPKATQDQKASILATGSRISTACTILTLLIVTTLEDFLINLLGWDRQVWRMGIIWTLSFVFYSLAISRLAALERFRARANAEAFFGILLAAGIFLTLLGGNANAWGALSAYAIAYAVAGAFGMAASQPIFSNIRTVRARDLLIFGFSLTIGAVAFALIHGTGRIVGRSLLTPSELGVLSAYQTATVNIALYGLSLLQPVLFPAASSYRRHAELQSRLRKIAYLAAAPVVGGFGIGAYLLLIVIGSEYPRDFSMILPYATAATLATYHGILCGLYASAGVRGTIVHNASVLVAGCTTLVASLLLIETHGISGAGWSLAAGLAMGTIIFESSLASRWAFREA